MRRIVIGLLLGATAAPALAQDGTIPEDRRGARREARVEAPGERQDRGETRSDRPEPRQDRAAVPEVRQDRAAVQGDRTAGRYDEAGRDRVALQRDRGEPGRGRIEQGDDRLGRTPGRYPVATAAGQRDVRADGRDDARDPRNDRRDQRDDRRDDRDDRGDWRGGDGRGQAAGWRGDGRGDGGQWSRNWRQDRRYDWQSYRQGNRSLYRAPRYYAPRGYAGGYRRWSPGYRLQPFFYDRSYWIGDPRAYRLPPAYGAYRWVRYYDDVLLIDLRSGLVADAIYGFFW